MAEETTATAETAPEPGPAAQAAVKDEFLQTPEDQKAHEKNLADLKRSFNAVRAAAGQAVAGDVQAPEDDDRGRPEPEGAPQPVELTQRQREAAKQFGYSEQDIAELGDRAPSILQMLGERFDRRMAEIDKEARAKAVVEPEPPAEPEPEPEPEPEDGRDPEGRFRRTKTPAADEFLGLDEDGFPDPERSRGAFRWLLGQVESVSAVRQQVEGLVGQLAQVASFIEATRLDGFWHSLPAHFVTTYGQGHTRDLTEGSPERTQRERIERLMREIQPSRKGADMLDILRELVEGIPPTNRTGQPAGSYNPRNRKPPARQADPDAQAKENLTATFRRVKAAHGQPVGT